ncbi:hypothetical protein AK812_SmicGene25195 [Symbiodinium microadriaticum]|uniref:Uncharacterized protein n=1 Tax=Symbiodinium microadriaticum TaxID=2951 RepID=A0A1Q9DCZ8_SYMMI|nr:hypothetical protein AK812_SmicGene25195 [Symbiodinium microadriaticum]
MVGVRESFLPAWTACLLYFIVATWPVTTIPAKGDDSFATAVFPNAGTSTLLQHDGWHTSSPLLQGIHLEGLQRPLPLSHELVYSLKMRDQKHSVSCTVEGVAMQPDSQLQTTYLQLPDVGPQKQVFPVSPQVFLGSQLPAYREELNTRSVAHHIEPATSACKTHRALSAAVCNETNALGDGAQGQVGTAPGLMDMSGSRSAQTRQPNQGVLFMDLSWTEQQEVADQPQPENAETWWNQQWRGQWWGDQWWEDQGWTETGPGLSMASSSSSPASLPLTSIQPLVEESATLDGGASAEGLVEDGATEQASHAEPHPAPGTDRDDVLSPAAELGLDAGTHSGTARGPAMEPVGPLETNLGSTEAIAVDVDVPASSSTVVSSPEMLPVGRPPTPPRARRKRRRRPSSSSSELRPDDEGGRYDDLENYNRREDESTLDYHRRQSMKKYYSKPRAPPGPSQKEGQQVTRR